MVGAAGFEPATPWSQARCATKLRYAPSTKIILHGIIFFVKSKKALSHKIMFGAELISRHSSLNSIS